MKKKKFELELREIGAFISLIMFWTVLKLKFDIFMYRPHPYIFFNPEVFNEMIVFFIVYLIFRLIFSQLPDWRLYIELKRS